MKKVLRGSAGSLTSAYRVVNATLKYAESDSNLDSAVKQRDLGGIGYHNEISQAGLNLPEE